MELAGKSVLVTGAASGIGQAIAQRVAIEGPSVVICIDKNSDGATRTATAITAMGVTSYAIAIDLADLTAIDLASKIVLESHGCIDLLVCNAGVSFSGGIETDESAWKTSWDVNLMAQVRLARNFIPSMIENGGGYILNTASAAGLLTGLGALSYAVTKHGCVALSEWLAITHKRDNIRVSVLCPMGVRTGLLLPETDPDQPRSLAQAAVLEAGALLEPSDVAEAAVAAINAEQFLILPHPEVRQFYNFRANNTEKWITAMARYQENLLDD